MQDPKSMSLANRPAVMVPGDPRFDHLLDRAVVVVQRLPKDHVATQKLCNAFANVLGEPGAARADGFTDEAYLTLVLMEAERASNADLRDVADRIKANNANKQVVRDMLTALRQWQQNPTGPEPPLLRALMTSHYFGDALRDAYNSPKDPRNKDSMEKYQRTLETALDGLDKKFGDISSELSFELQVIQQQQTRATKVKSDSSKNAHTIAMDILRNLKA